MSEKSEQELRELDDFITEHVMGWSRWTEPLYPHRAGWSFDGDTCISEDMPKWSTDPAAAMEVLKKCVIKCETTIEIISSISSTPSFSMRGQDGEWLDGRTLELVICLSAKKLFSNPQLWI